MTSAVLVWIHGLIQLVHERLRCVGVSRSFFSDELLLNVTVGFLASLSFGLETLMSTQFSVARPAAATNAIGPKINPPKNQAKPP